ncbi:MAG: putative toxin-antitoxin system toxin component, PIN family [Terracidiphilus sp.]|jgi:putative PIN family toxin of toxin-antitoxin system
MTRAVLDTNVLVSALISPFGNEALVLLAVEQGRVAPCFSPAILEEYAGVLSRPKFNFAEREIDGLIELLRRAGLLFETRQATGTSPDPKDEAFIACAIASGAEFLVTGNRRHFPAQSYGRAKVVSSRELIEFLSRLRSR